MPGITVIGQPNPAAVQYLLDSILRYVISQQEKVVVEPVAVELPVLVSE
jgi:hypothetical protein